MRKASRGVKEATKRDATNSERVDRQCDKRKDGGNKEVKNDGGDFSRLSISENEMKCICNNYRNKKQITAIEFEVHKRFGTRIQNGWYVICSLLLDTIQFVRLSLMMFYYCKQENQSMFSGITNSTDLDKQLFEYISTNKNTMFDSEYDICRTVEMMVMGKKMKNIIIIRK